MSNHEYQLLYSKFINKIIPYTLNEDEPDVRTHVISQFIITKQWIDYLKYYCVKMYQNKEWIEVSSINWGHGYSSTLYGDLDGNLIIINGNNLNEESNIIRRLNINDI